jgi:two-component system response regulator QseB
MSVIPLPFPVPLWPLRYIALLDPVPIRVLLTGDDEELRRRVAMALRGDGHVVVEAVGGAATPSTEGEDRPDILVSAVRTPGRTHLQTLASVRRDGRPTPVVLITASADERAQLEAYRLGANVVLGAGADIDELLISVRGLVPDRG